MLHTVRQRVTIGQDGTFSLHVPELNRDLWRRIITLFPGISNCVEVLSVGYGISLSSNCSTGHLYNSIDDHDPYARGRSYVSVLGKNQ